MGFNLAFKGLNPFGWCINMFKYPPPPNANIIFDTRHYLRPLPFGTQLGRKTRTASTARNVVRGNDCCPINTSLPIRSSSCIGPQLSAIRAFNVPADHGLRPNMHKQLETCVVARVLHGSTEQYNSQVQHNITCSLRSSRK